MMYKSRDIYVFVWMNLLFLTRIWTVEGGYSAKKETEIRNEVLNGTSYDMKSRPNDRTTVKIGINVLAIGELDLKRQKLQAVGWLTAEWTDSRLTWNPEAKDDIEEIFSKPADIWKPELVIANSLEGVGIIKNEDLYLRIKHNGTVEWRPPRLFTTHCEVDITFYPYDTQKCSIKIASWGYTSNEVTLDTLSTSIDLKEFEKHGEWIVRAPNVNYDPKHQFPEIRFDLTLERRTTFYNLNVLMPVFLMSLLVALTFIVPVECGGKLSYILTVFLSIAVLLTLVADSMPSTSITTSVLGLYLAFVTILSAVGILLAVIITILYHKEGYAKSRSCIMRITRAAAKVTCSSALLRVTSPNQVEPAQDEDEKKSNMKIDVFYDVTWKHVAIVLDRICFIVFSAVTVLMNLSFVMAIASGGGATDH